MLELKVTKIYQNFVQKVAKTVSTWKVMILNTDEIFCINLGNFCKTICPHDIWKWPNLVTLVAGDSWLVWKSTYDRLPMNLSSSPWRKMY